MILQSNQSAAGQNPATLLMRLRWLDFGSLLCTNTNPAPSSHHLALE